MLSILAASFPFGPLLFADYPPAAKVPVGKETTYFTQPLDKEGYVDYQAALNARLGKGITPQANANVLLWKALGPKPEGEEVPAEYFKLLGIEPPPEGANFIDLRTYLKDHGKVAPSEFGVVTEQQILAGQRPWKKKDYPHVAAWLGVNEKPLILIIEASRRLEYFNPLIVQPSDGDPGSLFGVPLPGVQSCREIARALTARAMLRLDQGMADEAWQDLLACHRLGRLVGRGATFVEGLVGYTIDAMASKAALVFLEQSNSRQIFDRLKDLQALPAMPPIADKIDLAERVSFLDSWQLIRRGRMKPKNLLGLSRPVEKASAAELKAMERIDWKTPLQNGNHWFDRLAAAMRVEDRTWRQKLLAKLNEDLKALNEKTRVEYLTKFLGGAIPPEEWTGDSIGDILIRLMLPALSAGQAAQDRFHQTQRNLQVAFALGAYHRDHERFPAKLDELAPKYLPRVPDDLFAGKALVYLPREKGYLLYSVGENGQDDGGRGRDELPVGDDLSVQMPMPKAADSSPRAR